MADPRHLAMQTSQQASPAGPPRIAAPPRSPTPSLAQLAADREHRIALRQAEARERRSVFRALLLLALLLLFLGIARAGLDRVFPHGWWRP